MQLFSSWTGSDFLLFYTMLLGLATFAAWWLPAHLREPGRQGETDDLESIALLAGGRERMADSLIADLYVRGALVPADKGKLHVAARDLPVSPGGKALLAIDAPVTLNEARRAIHIHADRVAARLRRAGLLLRPEEHSRLRLLSVAPFAALFALGLYRQRAGSALDEPTGFLIMLLGVTVALAVIRFAKSDPRTAAGVATVQQMRARNDRFARAPRPDEAAMAVALFGTGVLVGTPWEPVHAMRQKDGDGGGAEGSSDGGCGGGGCGGCGG
ncbi:TIGR04222 domain-containing membrane protein [uncultured Erythrobacter sp.]|uniref:TIGR04222 domain-containing membrane protein n=1 Tax=uncultured Erythrobacter sp. TaxID=263913 RepID=UPI00265B0BB1|nr:TIGR04222 domain-containing membrane protein [uncultured Erythrobacter sp.]